MSISTLPEWKQLLLKRKRQEEEEKKRKETEEEKRLASIPAWKREIIQKRKAKQDITGQREREKYQEGRELESEPQNAAKIFIVPISSIQQNKCIRLEKSYIKKAMCCNRRSVVENLKDKQMTCENKDNGEQYKNISGWEVKVKAVDVGNEQIKGELDVIPTIRAENIIIVEEKRSDKVKHLEEKDRQLQSSKEIGLKEILFTGERLTEVRASEIVIIRPTFTDGWSKKRWVKTTEQANQIPEIGHVSLLISKFGQNHNAPSRSKSSECFMSLDEGSETGRKYKWMNEGKVSAAVPKRSYSFSDKVMNTHGGLKLEGKGLVRSYSDRKKKEVDGRMGGTDGETKKSGSNDEPGRRHPMFAPGLQMFNRKCARINTDIDGKTEERLKIMDKEVKQISVGITESQMHRELKTNKLGPVRKLSNGENKIASVKCNKKIHIPRAVFFGNNEPGLLTVDGQSKAWDDEGKDEDIWGEENYNDKGKWDKEEWENILSYIQNEEKLSKETWEKRWQDVERSNEDGHGALVKRWHDEVNWDEPEQYETISSQEESVKKGQSQGSERWEKTRQDEDTFHEKRQDIGVEKKRSWNTGKPLTRVDSLKERILQKEQAAEIDCRQEVASPQTFSSFYVTREVSEEELPVSAPASLSAEKQLFSYTERHGEVTQREANEDEDLLGGNYFPPSLSPSSSSSASPSSSPPIESYPTMSRIYNLKPVSPRTGGCLTERKSDVQTRQFASGLPKIPISLPSSSRNKDASPLYSVQRQVEQINLKDQEVLRPNDEDTQNTSDDQKPENNQRTSSSQQTASTFQTQSTLSTKKTIKLEITSPSRPLFTIRSASGGPGRKGHTITVTPKKLVSVEQPQAAITSPKTAITCQDHPKKRFPTAEEIEVIGGYKHLERSCLVRKRISTKMVSMRSQ